MPQTRTWLAWLMTLCACAACGDDTSSPHAQADAAAQSPGAAVAGHGGASGNGAGGSAGTAVGKTDGAVPAGPVDAGSDTATSDAGRTQPALDAAAAPADADAGNTASACGICEAYGTPEQTGTVDKAGPSALSGLALSRTQPGIAFVHDDHDRAVVYAIDLQGRVHARFTLDDTGASDLEDIAVGPCGAGSCVYLGDIGDNASVRGEYAVLRFAEPTVPSEPGTTSSSVEYERFAFHYEDGSHNAESLLVAPDGTLYVITKVAPGTGGSVRADGPSSVYGLPLPLAKGEITTAHKVATLPVPAGDDQAASAAAAHPCGLGFLLRTYDRVYEFRAPAGASFEAAFAATPQVVAMPNEPQSEGIDYRSDGRGFVTSGEGAGAPIVATDCR
jgi:hypothetical protein